MDAGTPSGWVTRWAHLVAPGADVLDVASGSGRHARWLAKRGHAVLAVDRDAEALASLSACAGITTLVADLEGAPWPLSGDRRFGAVVVTNYLHRPLFGHLIDSLAPGGVLIYETFAAGNERIGKPSNPAFLLTPGELLEAVRGRLRVIAYEDGSVEHPRAAYVQRICAVLEAQATNVAQSSAAEPLTVGNTAPGSPRYDLAG
ncbi:class I SAM-dependent methyltransferase [Caballeronia sp. LZ062]|uniref:class I SAM-dependent methyltransferase n=1 Tax=unclassified Caballeronia TaxID=2646786 RepID=UPI00285E646A|nr:MULTISPECIES: class I SAM-dependent methyltransferase [unclassified Caballeronia]MDR5854857.1 class I SAM-dependent methyltransferase [Caballeronia sp. LZ050]MDR5870614.1 class I SAM-dependent methyltransferase [Caballeronia sp. LZ062]